MGDVRRAFGRCDVMAHDNCDTEDLTLAMLEFDSGARGSIVTTTTFTGGKITRVGFHGTGGAALLDDDGLAMWEFEDQWQEDPLPVGPANIVEDMMACIRGERDPACPPEEGRKSVEVLRAVLRSNEQGTWLDLPLDGA
ncbi:MAG: Gfo/Idh/MocA family oxidoreductase, partial [Gemmatimonadota bacterium]|nr:Gfo/Idh/MocA family oxidoreductase [Gemmatimonadota bacterium]